MCSARASKARSRTGSPLRSSARPTNRTSRRSTAARLAPGAVADCQVDPVRDDLVRASVPAPPGPGGGLGDRDPLVQLVELALRAEHVRDPVRTGLRRIRVEGADDGCVGERAGIPGEHRGGRLLHVDDVELAGAELTPHAGDRIGQGRDVGDGAVRGNPDRATERDQVVRARPDARFSTAVERASEAIGRVPGGQDADLVIPGDEVLGERLGMPIYAPLVRPRIWRDESDSHVIGELYRESLPNVK